MTFGRIIAPYLMVAFSLTIPFLLLLFAWVSPRRQARPHTLRESLPQLPLWFASSSFVLASVSLVRVEMIAPIVPSLLWIVLNWTSVLCWVLVAFFAWFVKGRQRVFLLLWWFVFPIFVAMLFMGAYTY